MQGNIFISLTQEQSSYRQIFKTTSIFGGVKVFEIIVKIINSKIIAYLLGTEGMGIQGLYTSTVGLISGLTNFGLGTSAVKNVSAASSSGDQATVAKVIIVLRRLVWITGILGALIMMFTSSLLSKLTFGNDEYTVGFVWLSTTLLLNQISTGQSVILRGLRKINYLAKSSLTGAVLGLAISTPFYYLYGIDGIVPAIILTSLATLFRTWFYSRKVKIEPLVVNYTETIREGKSMLTLGFMLSVSGLYVLAKNYGIRAYIANLGGIDQVGLYTAGFVIINTYVGMIFTAMSTDFFPRLSAVAHDNTKSKELINQQAEIAIIIMGPIITVFIVFISWIILILYSDRFADINTMVQWASLGMFFKAISWSMAFIYLAKGASKLFITNELVGGTVTLLFQLVGYSLGGLTGMGVGFTLGYAYYTLQVYAIISRIYNFNFSRNLIKTFIVLLLISSLSFIASLTIQKPGFYLVGIILVFASIFFSYIELNKRLNIKQIINKRLRYGKQ